MHVNFEVASSAHRRHRLPPRVAGQANTTKRPPQSPEDHLGESLVLTHDEQQLPEDHISCAAAPGTAARKTVDALFLQIVLGAGSHMVRVLLHSHTLACADATLANLLTPDAFPAVARAPRMIKDVKDSFATFPRDLNGVRLKFFERPGLDTVVTSLTVIGAYRTHDFGFDPLRALRCASGDLNGVVTVHPRRVNEEDPEEGLKAFMALEKEDMERLRKNEELLRWAQVR